MAIRLSYTDPRTGSFYPEAHVVLRDPLSRPETHQVTVQGYVYADKASYDAGKQPIGRIERQLDSTVYDALYPVTMGVVEPPVCEQIGGNARPVAD